MKGRNWVLILFMCILLAVTGIFVAIKHFQIDTRLRERINGVVSGALGGDFTSSSMYITPWSFGLKNVQLSLHGSPLIIKAKRIRIDFSFIQLIKNKGDLPSGATNLFFDEPSFVWNLDAKPKTDHPLEITAPKQVSFSSLPKTRIHLLNGSLHFTRGDSTLVMGDSISGWLDGKNGSIITLNAEGNILSDSINTHITADIDRISNVISLSLDGSNCDFTQKNLSFLTGDIVPQSGFLSFGMHIRCSNTKTEKKGEFSVENAAFMLNDTGMTVSDVDIEGKIDNDEVAFESVTGHIFKTSTELAGTLSLKPEPTLNLRGRADSVDFTGLFTDMMPDLESYPSGTGVFTAEITGNPNELSIDFTAASDSVMYNGHRIENIVIGGNIHESRIDIDRGQAEYRGYALQLSGGSRLVAASNEPLDFNITSSLRQSGSKKRILFVSMNGNGSKTNRIENASFSFILKPDEKKPEDLKTCDTYRGTLTNRRDIVDFSLSNSILDMNGSLDLSGEQPLLDSQVKMEQAPLLHLFGIDSEGIIVDGVGTLSGAPDSLFATYEYQVGAGENLNSFFTGTLTLSDILSNSRHVRLASELKNHRLRFSHPMHWTIGMDISTDASRLTINDPSGLDITVSTDHNTKALNGMLTLDELPLEWIIDIFKKESFGHRAKLTGNARIFGSLSDPQFETLAPIEATDMKLGGIDLLTGKVSVAGSKNMLAFTGLDLKRRGVHILDINGTWNSGNPFILDAVARGAPLDAIGDVISKDRMIDGSVNIDTTFEFTRKRGTVTGGFSITDGHFLDVPFDRVDGEFGGGSTGFVARNVTMKKDGVYTGSGTATSGFFYKDRTEAPGLKMNLDFDGDLMRALPHLTGAIDEASGQSKLSLTIGGTWEDPEVMDMDLQITNGRIEPSFLVDEVTKINATLSVDDSFETVTGLRPVRIRDASAEILDKKLVASNVHIGDPLWERIKRPELLSIINSMANLDFGVILGSIEKGGEGDASLVMNVPGFMKMNDTGTFIVSGEYRDSFVVGAAEHETGLKPFIAGTLTVLSGDIAYPLLVDEEDGAGIENNPATDIFWDIEVKAGPNVNYMNEENIRWRVGGTTISRTLARLDENTWFKVHGRLSDESFRVTGYASSMNGTISYYGTEFDIERAEFRLDSDNKQRPATLAATARATVYSDSTDSQTEITLSVYFIDKVSGERKALLGRTDIARSDFRTADTTRTIDAGALGTLQIEFTSSDPSDNTMEKILERLGISPDNIMNAATGAFAAGVDNYYFDSFMRPFEEAVRKYTTLDVVRFTPSMLGNLMRYHLGYNDQFGPEREFMLFDRSRIMVGEYFLDDWFLSYRGQYGMGRDYLRRKERGFYHEVALQYLLKRRTRFQLNYNYDEVINKGEKRIVIRHDFEF